MNKNILITGGTGLVGSDITNLLLQNNNTVFATGRKEPVVANDNLHFIRFDIANDNFEKLKNALPSIDGIIHAAAYVGPTNTPEETEYCRKANIEFTNSLFQYASSLDKNIPVIYISSFSVLAKPLITPIKEDHIAIPKSFYALSKYYGELFLKSPAKAKGIRPIVFRISSPVGKKVEQLSNVVSKWIDLASKGKSLTIQGSGEKTQDFVSTEDIANAVMLALDYKDTKGVYNITSGNSISINELANEITSFFHVQAEHKGEDVNENDKWNISIEKAEKELGYKPKFSSADCIKNLLHCSFENRNT
jgi:UDP-glucose 4-epimerase